MRGRDDRKRTPGRWARRARWVIAAAFAAWASSAQAATIYMKAYSNILKLDLDTGITTVLVNAPKLGSYGIAYAESTRTLYSLDTAYYDGTYTLLRVNQRTGAVYPVGDLDLADPFGLTNALDDSSLYARVTPQDLASIDPTTGDSLVLGPMSFDSSFPDFEDLATAPVAVETIAGTFPAGTIFGLDTRGDFNNLPFRLWALDPVSLHGTEVGLVNGKGLTFAPDGTLYINDGAGTLSTLDLVTLATTFVATTNDNVTQLAFALDVPEPNTGALLGLGVAAVVAAGRRRRRMTSTTEG